MSNNKNDILFTIPETPIAKEDGEFFKVLLAIFTAFLTASFKGDEEALENLRSRCAVHKAFDLIDFISHVLSEAGNMSQRDVLLRAMAHIDNIKPLVIDDNNTDAVIEAYEKALADGAEHVEIGDMEVPMDVAFTAYRMAKMAKTIKSDSDDQSNAEKVQFGTIH